jgi:hypothetical protein
MSQVNDQVMEQTEAQQEQAEFNPIFSEIEGITEDGALNILVQAAGQAQAAGALTVRDSVMVAKAISVLRPGSI